MRLHRLELEGFGPFRARQEVRFDAFAADGIFLIAGRTGAGKSSVLDGICFALYGGVPRYDGGDRRLRSDHSSPEEPTRVAVEFTTAGRRWRVTRSPEYERPKQRGTGLTTEPHRAVLEELVDGEWIGRAARPVDVARELDDILGLNQQQFLQVILLAQNRFAEFLLARNDDRQRLLRRLFGTRGYEDYQSALERRRKEAERALAAAGDGVAMLLGEAERVLATTLDDVPPVLPAPPDGAAVGVASAVGVAAGVAGPGGADAPDAAPAAVRGTEPQSPSDARPEQMSGPAGGRAADAETIPASASGVAPEAALADPTPAARLAAASLGARRVRYRVETLALQQEAADAALRRAEEALGATRALHEKQQQRARSRTALEALEARVPSVAAARAELAHALDAEGLRAPIESAVRAERTATGALAHTRRAREAWAAAGEETEAASGALRSAIERLTGEIALCGEAARYETALVDQERALAEERARADESAAILAAIDARRAALPAQLADLDTELETLHAQAAALAPAEETLAAVAARLEAAREAERLAAAVVDAEAAHLRAGGVHDRARAAVTALLQRRLAGHAGELAAALVEGEACAVCGSTEHPAPASASDDPVTADEIAQAEAARDGAADLERAESERARDARAAHADAAARAAGETAASLEAQRAATLSAVESATDASSRRDLLSAERAALTAADADAAAERDRLGVEHAAGAAALASSEARAAADRMAVEAARGPFPTVRERIDDATARRALATDLLDALADADAAEAAARDAAADLATRVAASVFDDAASATAALREASARAALDAGIRDHDAALRAERERLRELELELAGVPDEPVDVTAAEAAHTEARLRWRSIVDAVAAAVEISSRVDDLVARADAAHEGLGPLSDEHAVVSRLANTVAGRAPNTHRMTLESFVLAAELEEIVRAANLRLDAMSSGRYRLLHTDALAARGAASGLGIEIMDAHTGQSRPAQSLSGGETFLASLALALGLAEVVTARSGGVRLDTLFIDEGFGSLDEETLELAMGTLDELRQGGRTVGLISHVPAMKERLSAQLVVAATPQGPSVIRQDAAGVPA